MNNSKLRMLAILLPIAAFGAIAGCGDDQRTSAGSGGATTAPTTTPAPKVSDDAAQVDRAFVRQMVPHHLMAVEMAEMAGGRAEHDEIEQLATDIIAAQTKEIADLRAVAKTLGVTPDAPMGEAGQHGGSMAGDAKALGLPMAEMGMSMDMASLKSASPFDRAFIGQMIAHHRGAVAMAKAELAGGENAELKRIATAIIAAQEKELTEMAGRKADWYGEESSKSAPAGGHSMPGM